MARFIADIEIHSKYARAVSPQMVLENLALWAVKKGIKVLGTGDFTHPLWFKDIKEKLESAEPGLFQLKEKHCLKSEDGFDSRKTRSCIARLARKASRRCTSVTDFATCER